MNIYSNDSKELSAYIVTLKEFEIAHRRWMDVAVDCVAGKAAKQYKNSCMATYTAARKAWEQSVRRAS